MSGKERRREILNMIQGTKEPISGTELAKIYNVSRQVIVQDIALLRAENNEIYSTTRGYIVQAAASVFSRIFSVNHSDENIEDELNTIIDLGGTVADVFIEHEIYGKISAEMNINSRRKVKEFVEKIKSGASTPLKNLTFGKHFHTVKADSEETLDLIEKELNEKGYLISSY